MSEETRMLKEILDNADLDNYAIDDDECYLSGYARKCLKKVLDQLQQKENIIKEAKEYINNHQLVFEISNKKQIAYWFDMFYKELLEILDKENK